MQALSETQRKVLIELCRPYADRRQLRDPGDQPRDRRAVFLSVDAVKGHLRVLFDRFGLADLPQNEKRARLAEQALRSGAVRVSDLG